MTQEVYKSMIESLNDGKFQDVVYMLVAYIDELEKRIEKLEAKDFTRNEPLIGGYDY